MNSFARAISALISCACVMLVVSTAQAQPALVTVSDEDTTVYLIGTIHFMPPGVEWRTEEIDAALSGADAVYFEADVQNVDQVAVQSFIMEHGTNPEGVFLSSLMSPEQYSEFSAYVTGLGLSAATLEPLRPWYAALNLGVFQVMSQGYDPESGIDQVLAAEAVTLGKPLRFFEDIEFQLRLFSNMGTELELEMLLATIESGAATGEMLDQMLAIWLTGDYDELDRVVNEETRASYPEFFATVYSNRNAAWAAEIETLMENEPGTFLIAVGSGHLGGVDGVPELLRARGLTVQ